MIEIENSTDLYILLVCLLEESFKKKSDYLKERHFTHIEAVYYFFNKYFRDLEVSQMFKLINVLYHLVESSRVKIKDVPKWMQLIETMKKVANEEAEVPDD